jgi:hypothetical protein
MNLPVVIKTEEIQYNWNSWNDMQNTFNLHVIDHNKKYPKNLVIQAWKWFLEYCEFYHIDHHAYRYAEIRKWDYDWTIDFTTQPDYKGACFQLYGICYDSRNKKILQASFGIG